MGCSNDLFQNLRQLRALTLKNLVALLKNLVELSDTMNNLINLRYLNLIDYYDKLLETIYNMCNLQILNISEYIALPRGMRKLINLRYLIILGDCLIFPKGFGRMVYPRTLKSLSINDKDTEGCDLGELKILNNLM